MPDPTSGQIREARHCVENAERHLAHMAATAGGEHDPEASERPSYAVRELRAALEALGAGGAP